MKKSHGNSDTSDVGEPEDRLPTAWLFTRGDSSVHMEVIERSRGLHLTVRGPGLAVASYDFADREAFLAFTREQELQLLAAGFQLQAVAERRSGGGSHSGGVERRRRQPV